MIAIIGLTGKKGSGKDEARAVIKHNLPYVHHLAFADTLKEAAKLIWGLTDEQVYGPIEVKETVDEVWGLTPREILQKLGTEVARHIHPQTWVKGIELQIQDLRKHYADLRKYYAKEELTPTVVLTDIRFLNEAEAIKEWGGIVVRIIRPEKQGSNKFAAHASEVEQEEIKADVTILNDGTLQDYHHAIERLCTDIQQGSSMPKVISARSPCGITVEGGAP